MEDTHALLPPLPGDDGRLAVLTRGAWRWLVLLPVATLFLAACGGSSNDNGVATLQGAQASASASPTMSAAEREQLALKFAQCMRENGVKDFPDPTVDENGNLTLRPGAGLPDFSDREKIRKAFQACQQYAAGLASSFSTTQVQEMQDQMLKFAQCMRDNGYDMPDPTFDGPPSPGSSASPGDRGPFGGINQDDPAFKKAFDACRDQLPGIPGGGPGGAGGG